MKPISGFKRAKQTGKGAGHSFVAIPHHLLASDEFGSLSAHAVKMLIELFRQYKGSNNGDLSAPWSRLKRRGWRSKDTLWKALSELLETGFISLTRKGGRHHVCTLYAVTWKPVDECGGKLHVSAERVASNLWQKQKKSSLCVPQEFAMRTPEAKNDRKVA